MGKKKNNIMFFCLTTSIVDITVAINKYINSTVKYIAKKDLLIKPKIGPKIKPNTKRSGKNCLAVAGEPNFLFTKGLNKPYW